MSALRVSVPGRLTRLILDPDLFLRLTQRQRHVLEVVRSYNGNRSRAARELGINVAAVQAVCRTAAAVGIMVPAGVTRRGIPNREPAVIEPRCHRPMRSGRCGRAAGHVAGCTSEAAWFRRRLA